jgi:hypothetical protein
MSPETRKRTDAAIDCVNKRSLTPSYNNDPLAEGLDTATVANLYAIFLLIALNIFCFYRSVNGFFLADDFSHVDYLHQVFAGHPELLLQNFYSNWLQAQGTKFFRPFISITMAWDYLFWKNNPLGFHLTNLCLQIASSTLLFLTTRLLFPLSKRSSFWLALAAAALFAVNPLHPEVVSWIIARVDSVASTFLLASFYLHQRSFASKHKRAFSVLSFVCFAIALMSKETSITLPPTLFVWHFLFPEQCTYLAKQGQAQGSQPPSEPARFSFLARLRHALHQTWIYWSVLVFYIGYRAMALGTVIGGYGGAIGQGLSKSFWQRWLDRGSIDHVFFPFNDEVFHNPGRLRRFLRWTYQGMGVVFAASSCFAFYQKRLGLYWRMIAFAGLWFVTAMLPTYQVWNLSANLQGSRFIYMGSLPLALFLALLTVPAWLGSERRQGERPNWRPAVKAITALSCIVMCAYTVLLAGIAKKNDSAWYHASRGVRALYRAVQAELAKLPPTKPIILMNLPSRYQGAHMLYNGFTFGALLRPPFMNVDSTNRVHLFEPIEFGDSDLINVGRLHSLITTYNLPVYKWDEHENRLLPVALAFDDSRIDLVAKPLVVANDQLLLSPAVGFSAAGLDYLDISMKISDSARPGFIKLSWAGQSRMFSPDNFLWSKLTDSNGKLHTRIQVSEHKKWLQAQHITRLGLSLSPAGNYHVQSLKISSGRLAGIPTLSAGEPADSKSRGMLLDELGLAHPHKAIGFLKYDATNVPNADHVVFQISKADCWFEQTSDSFRSSDRAEAQTAINRTEKALKGDRVVFNSADLKVPGFFEIRIGAEDKNNHLLGSYSDPLNFHVNEADVNASK